MTRSVPPTATWHLQMIAIYLSANERMIIHKVFASHHLQCPIHCWRYRHIFARIGGRVKEGKQTPIYRSAAVWALLVARPILHIHTSAYIARPMDNFKMNHNDLFLTPSNCPRHFQLPAMMASNQPAPVWERRKLREHIWQGISDRWSCPPK